MKGVTAGKNYQRFINRNNKSYRHGGDRLDTWIQKLLEIESDRRAPCLVLDIGANIGTRSDLYSKWSRCIVHAYEPMPSTYSSLIKYLKSRKVRKVFPHNIALGSGKRNVTFRFSGKSGGASLLSTKRRGKKISVQVSTVDFEFPSASNILFVKIDAEGLDLEVLRGMEGALNRGGITAFIWEHHGTHVLQGNVKYSAHEAVRFVEKRGYHVYIAGSDNAKLKALRVDGGHWDRMYDIMGKGPYFAGVLDFFAIKKNHPFEKRYISSSLLHPSCLQD
eukprot:CAMPEP_0182852274 /NCGR_PEP_ID=MMETSP0034_2-20130328/69_1 /TAXON_ID=156128 /ORGANISM="Nephroselmis pyriformis, Strain CCMP717" /LENGTH=276 /DNA_ID=CAMNT_0024982975 /DNA_START=837 /DNA_END=1667 /DNA_ORIENTATION=-